MPLVDATVILLLQRIKRMWQKLLEKFEYIKANLA